MHFGRPVEQQRDAISVRQRRELAGLLRTLAKGERIAAAGAAAQRSIAPDPAARRFLGRQLRQERFHARVFEQAAAWLGGDRLPAPGLAPLARLEKAGRVAVARGDFIGSVLVQQVVLEAVGHVVLHRLDDELSRRDAGLIGLRRLILHQEDGHQAFGETRLTDALAAEPDCLSAHRAAGGALVASAEALLDGLAPALATLNESAVAYRHELRAGLPGWMLEHASAA